MTILAILHFRQYPIRQYRDITLKIQLSTKRACTKNLFLYARILCLVVRGGNWGLEACLGDPGTQVQVPDYPNLGIPTLKWSIPPPGAWSPSLEVKRTYSLPLQPLGGGCTMPASILTKRVKRKLSWCWISPCGSPAFVLPTLPVLQSGHPAAWSKILIKRF